MKKLNQTYFFTEAHLNIARERYFLKDDEKQLIEQDINEVFAREVNHIYQNDLDHKENALRLRQEKKILPAGRPLAQSGTKTKNLFNCFVQGFEDDTKEAISKLKTNHLNIQAQGGGVGINFSTLRPRGAVCKTNSSRSSGAVGFITDISYQAANVMQPGNRCLPGNTRVAMADGTYQKIEQIRSGDIVVAFDLTTGKCIPSKVVKFYENGKQEVFRYHLCNGHTPESTSSHRWLNISTNSETAPRNNFRIKTVEQMPKSSTKIGIPKTTEFFGSIHSKWAGILGFLLGDGCFTGETVKLSNTSLEIREEFKKQIPKDLLQTIWENDEDIYFSTNGKFQEYLRSISLWHCKAGEKLLADEIFKFDKESLIKLINGLIATDGWVNKSEFGICSTSQKLIDDIRLILRKFGINGTIYIDNRPKKGTDITRNPLWNFTVKHPDSYNKCIEIFNVPGKQYRAKIKNKSINHRRRDDVYFHTVKKIESLGDKLTFCIEIKHPDHLFVTEFGISHNSGANLGVLEDWHPDLFDFIHFKSEHNWENIREFTTIDNEDEFAYFQWNNPHAWQMFNVSVLLTDEFMNQVITDSKEQWHTHWNNVEWFLWTFVNPLGPKTGVQYQKQFTVSAPTIETAIAKASSQIPFYNIKALKLIKGPYTLTAKEWFHQLAISAHKDGCPGVVFIDLIRRYHNGEYFNKITALNACSEQPLPDNGVCALTSIVFPSFFINGQFDWDMCREAIWEAVRGLDNLLDVSKVGIDEIDLNVIKERRIGLGSTGIAELLILERIRYGSDEAIKYLEKLNKFKRDESYKASIELAKERGAFPAFNWEEYSKSQFIKELPQDIQDAIKEFGIRHVAILTVAPTGTTGTMIGYSQGCEPYYFMMMLRNSRVGSFHDGSPAFIKFLKDCDIDYSQYDFNLNKLRENIKVPDYFVEAHEITIEEHINTQAIFAKYTDSSVSKTVNIPNSATIEDVEKTFILAYKLGIKCTTVYRDGSKQQILEKIKAKKDRPLKITQTTSPKRKREMNCDIHHTSVMGEKWTVLVGLLGEKPYEVFCAPQKSFELSNKFKEGKIIKINSGKYDLDLGDFKLKNITDLIETDEHRVITRLLSTALRHGVSIEFISDQLQKADGTVSDFSKAILRVLRKYQSVESLLKPDFKCPQCGSINVILQGGCPQCIDCSWSKCG